MRAFRQSVPIALALVLLVSFSTVIGAAPAAASPSAPPCADVQFIGVAGSGERATDHHQMGQLVGMIADKAAELAPKGTTVSFYGVPYNPPTS